MTTSRHARRPRSRPSWRISAISRSRISPAIWIGSTPSASSASGGWPTVAEARRLRRAEFAVGAFGSTAFLLSLVWVLDAMRFHHDVLVEGVTGFWTGDVRPARVVLVLVAAFDVVLISRVLFSLMRGMRAQRRFIARLPLRGEREVSGRRVTVVASGRALAFCGGLLRPRIYLSEG